MNNFDRLQDRLDKMNRFKMAATDHNMCMPEYPTAAEMVADFVLLANCMLDLRREIRKLNGAAHHDFRSLFVDHRSK